MYNLRLQILPLPWSKEHIFCEPIKQMMGFPCGSAGKDSSCNVGDLCSIPGLRRSPGEGKGYPLQYSGLENFMDSIVHGVAKSWAWLSNFHFNTDARFSFGKEGICALFDICNWGFSSNLGSRCGMFQLWLHFPIFIFLTCWGFKAGPTCQHKENLIAKVHVTGNTWVAMRQCYDLLNLETMIVINSNLIDMIDWLFHIFIQQTFSKPLPSIR